MRNVAIVDDEPSLAAMVAMALEDEGFAASVFNDATHFLSALDNGEAFDVIVTDLKMPGVDGLELIQQLRDRNGPRRVVLISGCADRARDAAASIARTDGFDIVATFAKPFSVSDLADTLTRALGQDEPGVSDFRAALDGGTLAVFYQPVFDLAADRGNPIRYLEALVRWHHPKSGLLLPGQFLPLLETADDWRRLTAFVLSTAAADLANWRKQGFRPEVAINLPPQILGDKTIVATCDSILDRNAVRCSADHP